jgi:hypothetical protein
VNHTSGHKAGVAGVYNRATYFEGDRIAMQLVASYPITQAHVIEME